MTREKDVKQGRLEKYEEVISVDTRRAAAGGIVSALVSLTGILIVNISSGSEARILLQGMLPSIRFLCSAVMTAAATILALMLTMLSVSRAREGRFKPTHYDRVRQIALVDVLTFTAAIILLLFVSIPLSETHDDIPPMFYEILYYFVLGYATALGGALISIILMLYNAVTDIMQVARPDEESDMLISQD